MNLKSLIDETLIIPDNHGISMEQHFINDFNKLKLIQEKIDPLDNKLYQGIDIFYLTDDFDNYLGHLEYSHLSHDKIKISSTFSIQRGFYELLFKLILAKTPIKMIFGDEQQTKKAIGSWKKVMSKFGKQVVYNQYTKSVESYDNTKEDEYYITNRADHNHDKYIIGITESVFNIKSMICKGEDLLNLRRINGRTSKTAQDILVRFYDIDYNDAIEMVKLTGNY